MNKLRFTSPNWLAYKINNSILLNNISLLKGRVVDLGCGAAPYREDIIKVASEYIGVDWTNSLHGLSNVDIVANLCEPLPLQDGVADAVTSFQVMEHLSEPVLFLSEVYRILKPGGLLFITVAFMWHVHEAPHDYFRYTRHGLEYLLKKTGFVEIEIWENTGFWQMWVLKFNYHTERYARGLLRFVWIPIWWLAQILSPILDRYDKCPQETAGYTVVARKPERC
jgi:SAM-dependent methyltransferase